MRGIERRTGEVDGVNREKRPWSAKEEGDSLPLVDLASTSTAGGQRSFSALPCFSSISSRHQQIRHDWAMIVFHHFLPGLLLYSSASRRGFESVRCLVVLAFAFPLHTGSELLNLSGVIGLEPCSSISKSFQRPPLSETPNLMSQRRSLFSFTRTPITPPCKIVPHLLYFPSSEHRRFYGATIVEFAVSSSQKHQ